MATHTPWQLQVSSYSALDDRLALSGFVQSDVTNTNALDVRQGIFPGHGGQFLVAAQQVPNMTILVNSGVAAIWGTVAANTGVYIGVNDAPVTKTIAPAHATLPRIDIVVLQILDSTLSGVVDDFQINVITGAANSAPVASAIPVSSLKLGEVRVNAAVSSITNAVITYSPKFTVTTGGVVPSDGVITTGAYDGQMRFNTITDVLERFDGTAWRTVHWGNAWGVIATLPISVTGSIGQTTTPFASVTAPILAGRRYMFIGQSRYVKDTGTPVLVYSELFAISAGVTIIGGGEYGQDIVNQAVVSLCNHFIGPTGVVNMGIRAHCFAAATIHQDNGFYQIIDVGPA